MFPILLKSVKNVNLKSNTVVVVEDPNALKSIGLTKDELSFVKKKLEENEVQVYISRLHYNLWIFSFKSDMKELHIKQEAYRRGGNNILKDALSKKISALQILDTGVNKEDLLSFLEGLVLGAYTFDKYKKCDCKLEGVDLCSNAINKNDLSAFINTIQAIFKCRDLINEPLSYLTVSKFKEEINDISKDSGLKIDFFDEAKLATLKMGGILAVNKGSEEPPFLAVASWNPKNAINKKPYIIVGKGVVYDTGGYSLKPSDGMQAMKCDMSGAAVAINTISLLAKNKLPLYVVALIPATDNKVNESAQVPGDIITMHDGTTVEVLNTDAEGRLILADALSYAKRYDPELVVDLATLTGAAHQALGKYAMFAAGNKHEAYIETLKRCGLATYERLVEFPLWEEYLDFIKSKVADLKNTGGKYAGAISAAKFLEHFTDYPWIHLDIAGVAFYDKEWNYHPAGGTGIGVRLLYEFFKLKATEKSV